MRPEIIIVSVRILDWGQTNEMGFAEAEFACPASLGGGWTQLTRNQFLLKLFRELHDVKRMPAQPRALYRETEKETRYAARKERHFLGT